MKRIFMVYTAAFFIILFCNGIMAQAAAKASQGEKAFVKNCAVCHAEGGGEYH